MALIKFLKTHHRIFNCLYIVSHSRLHLPSGVEVKNLPANAGDAGLIPAWVGKIPGSRKWQPAPVFLPGTFHGQRSLVDYSPWGLKESDTTEHMCHAKSHSLLGLLLIKLPFPANANI